VAKATGTELSAEETARVGNFGSLVDFVNARRPA
jgi:hypothetical protein